MKPHHSNHPAGWILSLVGSAVVLQATTQAGPAVAESQPATAPLTGEQEANLAIVHDYPPAKPDQATLHQYCPTRVTLDDEGVLRAFRDNGTVTWPGLSYDNGGDENIRWGRWTRDQTGGDGLHSGHAITGAEGIRNSFRYVLAKPRDAAAELSAAGGVANYSLLGGNTGPTAGEGGGVSVTLLTAGSLVIDQGQGRVDIDLSLRVASGLYRISGQQLPLQGDCFASTTPVKATGTLCIAGCSANIMGFVGGADGKRAGLVFQIVNPALTKQINGVAAFAR